MARRSLFTVLLSVALVLSTSASPEASQGSHAVSASKSFIAKTDGKSPTGGARSGPH